MLFSRLDTIIAMSSDMSDVNSTLVLGGNSSFMAAAAARTDSEVLDDVLARTLDHIQSHHG